MENRPKINFLCWGPPWPPHSGYSLRVYGLLKEAAKFGMIRLIFLYDGKLEDEVVKNLSCFSEQITAIRRKPYKLADYFNLFYLFFIKRLPYHSAIAKITFSDTQYLDYINKPDEIVYCNPSHFWEIPKAYPSNWIIDQQNNDIDFWRIRRKEYKNPMKKLLASWNYLNSKNYFSEKYNEMSFIVSVCEEDKELTLKIAPETEIFVIENGIDCEYFKPTRHHEDRGFIQLLFTGTSDPRNVKSIKMFLERIFPHVLMRYPQSRLLIAGNFDKKRLRHTNLKNVYFTGIVDDIRDAYNNSDIFINPYFFETYGSKLKVAQALAMGMCVVTTKFGARGFNLVDGETALLANNLANFIEKLLIAVSDKDLRERIGNNARTYAKRELDWEILGKRLEILINKVTKRIETDSARKVLISSDT